MRFLISRSRDGTCWQVCEAEAFHKYEHYRRQGDDLLTIAGEADTWEEAKRLMGLLRDEDYFRQRKRQHTIRITVFLLLSISLLGYIYLQ